LNKHNMVLVMCNFTLPGIQLWLQDVIYDKSQ